MRWGLTKRAIFFLVLVLLAFILINARMGEAFKHAALARAEMEGVGAINRAVLDMVADQVRYEKLVVVKQDSQGQVVLVQPNPIEISRVVALTQLAVRDEMMAMEEKEISIPLGQVFGSPLLAGWGPHVKVRLMPVGVVKVNLRDTFATAGINQTRHLITLDIKTDIRVVAPFYADEIRVASKMPIAETIIVGRIPATYLNWDKGKNIDNRP